MSVEPTQAQELLAKSAAIVEDFAVRVARIEKSMAKVLGPSSNGRRPT